MTEIKKLAGQTVIYGISSIIGRMLFFILTPLYTILIFDPVEYGVITDFYAFIGIALVVFTYRMEMAFFRYGADKNLYRDSFQTALSSIIVSTIFFSSILIFLASWLIQSPLFDYPDRTNLLLMSIGIVALDALAEIPFAKLRLDSRPLRFALIRILGIAVNLGLNLFFLLFCPYALGQEFWSFLHPLIDRIYDPSFGIGYVFLANLASSAVVIILHLPQFLDWRPKLNFALWKQMMSYALPLIIVGFSFVINEMLDRKLIPLLGSGSREENIADLGIYGANYKLAMILSLFTQAFRYGAEPFFFKQRAFADANEKYAKVAKYFIIVAMIGFLAITLLIDLFKFFIGSKYWPGLHVVPILLLANLMLGAYYNFSLWYKLTDKTLWGAAISILGALITILLNIWWIPIFGYTGSAWATLICYTTMMLLGYSFGQKYYPIPYPVRRLGLYLFSSLILWGVFSWFRPENMWKSLFLGAILFVLFLLLLVRFEGKEIKALFLSRKTAT